MEKSQKVQYEQLVPQEFRERIKECPIAYLPLGTLEWHGEHLPYGTDAYIGHDFCVKLAQRVGGIVLPMLFMGVDSASMSGSSNWYDKEYDYLYGMDHWTGEEEGDGGVKVRDPGQLEGSAYWITDDAFNLYIEAIFRQLKRAGFKVIVAHGHGPSGGFVAKRTQEWLDKYGLIVLNCWGSELDAQGMGVQVDHAAMNETSLTWALRPDLVQMYRLSSDLEDPHQAPVAVGGKDPRIHASEEKGKEIIAINLVRMEKILKDILEKI